MSHVFVGVCLVAAFAVGWAIDTYLDRIRKYWNEEGE